MILLEAIMSSKDCLECVRKRERGGGKYQMVLKTNLDETREMVPVETVESGGGHVFAEIAMYIARGSQRIQTQDENPGQRDFKDTSKMFHNDSSLTFFE